MHRALIYQGALVCGAVPLIFALKGTHARRDMDELMMRKAAEMQMVGGESVEGLKQDGKGGESTMQERNV